MLARMLTRANQFGTKTDSNPSSDCEDDQEEDGKGNVREQIITISDLILLSCNILMIPVFCSGDRGTTGHLNGD